MKEEESTATFAPVIKLEAVAVKTFEEDEDVLYKQFVLFASYIERLLICEYYRRSKLFEFGETLLDKGTGKKQWKEKGVGEVKFLKYGSLNE